MLEYATDMGERERSVSVWMIKKGFVEVIPEGFQQAPNVYWAVGLVLNRPFLGALDHAGVSPECLGSGAKEED